VQLIGLGIDQAVALGTRTEGAGQCFSLSVKRQPVSTHRMMLYCPQTRRWSVTRKW